MSVFWNTKKLTIERYFHPKVQILNYSPGGEGSFSIENKRKSIRMMAVVVITFAICWLPMHIFSLLQVIWIGFNKYVLLYSEPWGNYNSPSNFLLKICCMMLHVHHCTVVLKTLHTAKEDIKLHISSEILNYRSPKSTP